MNQSLNAATNAMYTGGPTRRQAYNTTGGLPRGTTNSEINSSEATALRPANFPSMVDRQATYDPTALFGGMQLSGSSDYRFQDNRNGCLNSLGSSLGYPWRANYPNGNRYY